MGKSGTITPVSGNEDQTRSICDVFSQVTVQMVGSQISLCKRALLISVTHHFLLAAKDTSRNEGSGPLELSNFY